MTTHDHLRLVYIKRLWKAPAAEAQGLIVGESDEELVELKRVAVQDNQFGVVAMCEREELCRRLAHRNATEIFTNDAKRTAAYTDAMLTAALPPINSIALELAKQMAAQKDELIRKVARDRIGIIDDLDLAKRLKSYAPENRDHGTLWSLDDKPLVMIWPPTVGSVEDGSSMNRMQATFQYRIYP